MSSDCINNLIEIAKVRVGVYDGFEPFFSSFDTLSKNEINNINFVLRNLNIDFDNICVEYLDFHEVLTGAKESLKSISPDAKRIFNELYPDLKFVFDETADISQFESLAYPSIISKDYVARYTVQIVAPQKFEKCSKYFLAHEFIHVIKDINPNEVRLFFTKFETIPILWEFIQAYSDNDPLVMSRLFTERYKLMVDIKRNLYDANCFLKEYKNGNVQCDKRILREIVYIRKEALMYLNSFYYAVSLFNKFIFDECLVLNYINEVLECQITTKDLIDKFNQNSFDCEYQEGFNLIKSFIK